MRSEGKKKEGTNPGEQRARRYGPNKILEKASPLPADSQAPATAEPLPIDPL